MYEKQRILLAHGRRIGRTMSNLIPIIGQKNVRKIENITLPQPDGSFVEVQASAVVALAPEVIAAIASGILTALASRGLTITEETPSA
jgi:hypothetical protein